MSEKFEPKRYACVKWPFLRIGTPTQGQSPIKFNSGFYTANSQEAVDAIEKNEAYGIHIHPVLWKPSPTPSKPDKVQVLVEAEIEAALAESKPLARKGARGSR